MKRLLFTIVIILLLTSCSFGGENTKILKNDNNNKANGTFEKIVSSIRNRDNTQLESLFSHNVKKGDEDFTEKITNLIEFVKGDIVSFSDATEAGVSAEYEVNYGKKHEEIESAFTLDTKEQKYFIAIRECTKDDLNHENVGIVSIYIIKAEDWKQDYIYRGDGKWTFGINIR